MYLINTIFFFSIFILSYTIQAYSINFPPYQKKIRQFFLEHEIPFFVLKKGKLYTTSDYSVFISFI